MRSRTIREGSVGLLILLGIAVLGGMILWLRGVTFGDRSYQVLVDFENVAGMQPGAPVRYRGVQVGRIVAVRAGSASVEVEIEIVSSDLLIPRSSIVEANQVGLIGETSIDITPDISLPEGVLSGDPLDPNCNPSAILCDGTRLVGTVGVSYDAMIRSTTEIANLLTESGFFDEVRTLTRNSADAAESVAVLSREVTSLTRKLEQQVNTVSTSAVATAGSVNRAADQIALTASNFSATADQINELVDTNRASIVSTLDNINRTSDQLQIVLSDVTPTLQDGTLLQNLETLSANAAQASENLRDLSEVVGSSENMLMLQQTLDSARATFQNAQKITADLDELTGDPEFRTNLRNLIDGLSGLVSSVEHLQQQAEFAQTLTPILLEQSASPPSLPPETVEAAEPDNDRDL